MYQHRQPRLADPHDNSLGLSFSVHTGDDPPGGTGDYLWMLGLIAHLLAATLTIVGFMMQKSAHRKRSLEGGVYWMDARWCFGLGVWLLGQMLGFLSLGLAAQSLIAICNAWNIVVILVLAPFILGEQVRQDALLAVATIITGCVGVVYIGPKQHHQQTLEAIHGHWNDAYFLGAVSTSFVIAVAVSVRLWSSGEQSSGGSAIRLSRPQEFALLGSICAWYSVFLFKLLSSVFVSSVTDGTNLLEQVLNIEFWLVLASGVVCAVMGVHFVNMGLKCGESIAVLSTYESLSMVGQIIVCGTFLGDFNNFTFVTFVCFWSSIACVLLGICWLQHVSGKSLHSTLSDAV